MFKYIYTLIRNLIARRNHKTILSKYNGRLVYRDRNDRKYILCNTTYYINTGDKYFVLRDLEEIKENEIELYVTCNKRDFVKSFTYYGNIKV